MNAMQRFNIEGYDLGYPTSFHVALAADVEPSSPQSFHRRQA